MKKLVLALVAVGALVAPASAMAMTERAGQSRPTLTIRDSQYGRVIYDGRGFVLYAFTADRRGRSSNCYGACARAWPVYFAPRGTLRAGPGVKKGLLKTIRRRDGRRQVTYAGYPLYYYVGDNAPGVVRCQNVFEFGGLWLVQNPNGSLNRSPR